MSYAMAAALQAALFDRLRNDAAVTALTGGAIHDGLPEGPVPPLYVALGAEAARDRSDKTGAGAQHDVTLSVVTGAGGFAAGKAAAQAICDALEGPVPALARGRIVALGFHRARARRESDGGRRIDLTFRALLEDD